MALKVRALGKFPARVLGSGPITVSKANGIWTFGINTALLGAIASIPEADRDNVFALMYNSDTGTHSRVSMSTLFTMLGEGFDPLSLTAGAAINWDDQLILYHGINDGVFPNGRLGINTDTPDTQLHVTEAAGDTTHDTRICISNSTGTQRAGLLISNNTRHIDLLMGVPGATMLGNRWGIGLSGSATYPIIGEHDAGGGASTDGNIGIKASTAAAETIIHPLQVGVAETPMTSAANGAILGLYRDTACYLIAREKTSNVEMILGANTGGVNIGSATNNQVNFLINGAQTALLQSALFAPSNDDTVALGSDALRFKRLRLSEPLPATSGGTGTTVQTRSLMVKLTAVNFNSANSDNPITIVLPSGSTRWKAVSLLISGASGTLTTATCSLWTAAGGTGTAIVASASAITVSTASEDTNNNMQAFGAVNVNTISYTDTSIFFRVQTPQGSAATADVTFFYDIV